MSSGGTPTGEPEVTYTWTPAGSLEKVAYCGGTEKTYGYTLREWVERINDVDSPGESFAAFYDYENNGNIQMARFHNPEIDQPGLSGHNDFRYKFDYDALSRLTSADYQYGATPTPTAQFDVGGLAYDPSGNILALQRHDETGELIDDLSYQYQGNQLVRVEDEVQPDDGGSGPAFYQIYDDELLTPWMDVSWSAAVDYASDEQVWTGDFPSGWTRTTGAG